MSQLEFDITCFVLNNKEDLLKDLSIPPLAIFKDDKSLQRQYQLDSIQQKLTHYIIPIFNSNYEEVSSIITVAFISAFLYNKNI